MLAKTAGVVNLIVLINKMDDPTVEWAEERYEECKAKLNPFLKATGFKKEDIIYLPVSGLTGVNLAEKIPPGVCDWYDGPALIPLLDSLPKIQRLLDKPMRMPISDKYRDMGTVVMGKIQSGYIRKGQKMLMMPNKDRVVIDGIYNDEDEVDMAASGDNVRVKLKNIEEEAIQPGYVLVPPRRLCSVCTTFDAQLVVLEYKSIICPGMGGRGGRRGGRRGGGKGEDWGWREVCGVKEPKALTFFQKLLDDTRPAPHAHFTPPPPPPPP